MSSERRTLMVQEVLPKRDSSADRIAHMDEDVKTATGHGRQRLMNTIRGKGYPERGFVVDDDSWEVALVGRTAIISVSIERPE